MSIVNTRIQNVRANSGLDNNELRPSRYGGLSVYMSQTDEEAGIISKELKDKARSSIGSTLEVPVIDFDQNVTIGNSRQLVIADDENTSQMYQVSFQTYAWGFTMVPVMYHNNEIGYQKDWTTKFNKYLYKLGAVLDTACLASLATAKSQVILDPLTYAVTANKLTATYDERENILGDLGPIMSSNDHFNNINIIGNGGIESMVNKLAQKGLYNSENKRLEYLDKSFHFTPRLTNAATEHANGFAVQDGSVGMLTRFEREALYGGSMPDGTIWGTDVLPMLNLPVGYYYYMSKGDFSTIAGAATADMDRVRKEHYGFAVDIAYLTPYNSDPANIANPIVQFAINKPV